MRSILMSVMLMIVVIVIYVNIIGGESGAKQQIKDSGERINHSIERMNLYGQDS
jgi:hypothetical protein